MKDRKEERPVAREEGRFESKNDFSDILTVAHEHTAIDKRLQNFFWRNFTGSPRRDASREREREREEKEKERPAEARKRVCVT
mmetsp:Transcript_44584/g.88102  ORF Transcript_44584/g.88102 Transcript_44584/m.88102 type:complete len:83 (+) Transcript_44584:3024-3272(+)